MSRPADTLDTLLSALNDAVAALQTALTDRNLPSFQLDSPVPHPLDSGLPDPVSWFARKAIVGLAHKIIATVENPAERAVVQSNAWLVSACMNVVVESEPPVADLISHAGEGGADASTLAEKTGINEAKLRSIMRVLTSESYFKEIAPGRYIINRPASVLVTGNAIADLITFTSGPSMRAGSMLSRNVRNEGLPAGKSYEETAFQMYHDLPLYPWLQTNTRHHLRFHRGMTQLELYMDPGLSSDYAWEDLGEAVTLVDIGSGRGGLTMTLLKRFPGWHAVLQDREETLPAIREFWKVHAPEIVASNRVSFLAHDFFIRTTLSPASASSSSSSSDPDPDSASPRPPYVFLIKNVLHNWPDSACLEILQNIAPAATPGSTLLISSYTPAVPPQEGGEKEKVTVQQFFRSIFGKSMREIRELKLPVPEPLWADWGYGSAYETRSGATMTSLLNAPGRDVNDMKALLGKAGWVFGDMTAMRSAAAMIRAVKP